MIAPFPPTPMLPSLLRPLLAAAFLFLTLGAGAQTVTFPDDTEPSLTGFVGYFRLDQFTAVSTTPEDTQAPGLHAYDTREGLTAALNPFLLIDENGAITGSVVAFSTDSEGNALFSVTIPVEGLGRLRESNNLEFTNTGTLRSDWYRWSGRAGLRGIQVPESPTSTRFSARLTTSGTLFNDAVYPFSKNRNREDWDASVRLSVDKTFRGAGRHDITVANTARSFGGFAMTRTLIQPTDDTLLAATADAYWTSPFGARAGGETTIAIRPYSLDLPGRPGRLSLSHLNGSARAVLSAYQYTTQETIIENYLNDGQIDISRIARLTNGSSLTSPINSHRITRRYPSQFLRNP